MKKYTYLEVLFRPARAEILRLLFNPPQKERYVRELMGMSGLTLCAIQDELRKLTAVGLVTSRFNRYRRFYRANRIHPIFPDLVHLIQTSERASQISHSQLHRRKGARSRRRTRVKPLPPDRPINWHLFSKRRKT